MEDKSKEELKKLAEEVRNLSRQFKDAQYQLQILAHRMERSEGLHDKLEPNLWFVAGAKWFAGAFLLTVLAGILAFAYSIVSLTSDVRHQGEMMWKLEEARQDQEKAHKLLARLIIDRLLAKGISETSVPGYEGKIITAKETELVIETDYPQKRRLTFKLTPDTDIFIKGQAAKLENLKSGLKVRVIESEKGTAASILDVPEPPKVRSPR